MFSFGFTPKGWALCNGQLLAINQNEALFSLLGTTYGGDGRVNFALPNLQGRIPIHFGGGFVQGSRGGEEMHTLIVSEIPAHTHGVFGSSNGPNQGPPTAGFWPTGGALTPYAAAADANGSALAAGAVGFVGGGQPHENRPPFSVISFAIALTGIFPSQN